MSKTPSGVSIEVLSEKLLSLDENRIKPLRGHWTKSLRQKLMELDALEKYILGRHASACEKVDGGFVEWMRSKSFIDKISMLAIALDIAEHHGVPELGVIAMEQQWQAEMSGTKGPFDKED